MRWWIAWGLLAAGCAAQRNASSGEQAGECQRLREQARTAEAKGDLKQAQALLTQAVESSPTHAQTRWELSEVLYERGSVDAAAGQLREFVALNPDDPRGYVRLAETLLSQQRVEEAGELVAEALQLDPNCTAGLVLQGRLHELQQKNDRALESYHRAIICDPDQIPARLHVAAIHLKEGQPVRAAPVLRSILSSPQATRGQKSEAQWLLGSTYALQQRWPQAAAELAAAAESRRMTPDEWYSLAYARYQSGDLAGARRDADSALAASPGHTAALALQNTLAQRIARAQ